MIDQSTDIKLRGGAISAGEDGLSGNGVDGVLVRGSSAIQIDGVRFYDLFRGVTMLQSQDIAIRGNRFERIGVDGVAGGGIETAIIADNLFADFRTVDPERHHPDAIQFWDRNATRPNRDLTITGNVIIRGDGDPTQGIFIRTPRLQSQSIVITHNVIHQSMGQGIYLENIAGAQVVNNTVVAFDPDSDRPGIDVRLPGKEVLVSDNIATGYRLAPGLRHSGNRTIDYFRPWLDVHAMNLLVAPYQGRDTQEGDFAPRTIAGAQQFATPHKRAAAPHRAPSALPSPILDLTFPGAIVDGAPAPLRLEGGPSAYGDEGPIRFARFAQARSAAEGQFISAAPGRGASGRLNPTAAMRLSIIVRLRPMINAPDVWQSLVAAPNAFHLRIRGNRVDCLVNTDAGEVVRVSSATTALEDGRWHDVECRYDGGSGYMVIHVDGVALARDEASGGPVRFVATPALYVGGAPRQATFFGDIARVLIDR